LAGDDVRGEVGLYPAVVEGQPRPVDVPEAGDPAFDAKLRLVRGADRLRRALALGVTGAGGEDVEAAVALLLNQLVARGLDAVYLRRGHRAKPRLLFATLRSSR